MKHCGKCFEEFLLSSLTRFRSTHPEVFYQKDLKNFAKFTGRHLCQGLFFNKVAGLSLQLYLKKDPGASVFSCEFWRTPFWQNSSGWLLLPFVLYNCNILYNILLPFVLYNCKFNWILAPVNLKRSHPTQFTSCVQDCYKVKKHPSNPELFGHICSEKRVHQNLKKITVGGGATLD